MDFNEFEEDGLDIKEALSVKKWQQETERVIEAYKAEVEQLRKTVRAMGHALQTLEAQFVEHKRLGV